MTAEKPTLMDRILNIDRRIMYVMVVALMVWPMLYPFGLPIRIDKTTVAYYQGIESLPSGSHVLASLDIEAGLWGELGPSVTDTLQHLFDKDIKFIQICFYRADGQVVFQSMALPKVDQHNKKYGVDWVNMGFVAGGETAMSAFGADFSYPAKDAYGNLLSDLPLMKEMKSMRDVKLYVDVGAGDTVQALRQLAVPYKVPTVQGPMATAIPDMINYMNAGILSGILGGLPGAAQYEYLRQKPGIAIRGMDALSTTHIFLVLLVLITNIVYAATRRREKTR